MGTLLRIPPPAAGPLISIALLCARAHLTAWQVLGAQGAVQSPNSEHWRSPYQTAQWKRGLGPITLLTVYTILKRTTNINKRELIKV
eukprot:1091909-Pelagomonas_calceolata.AAC.1